MKRSINSLSEDVKAQIYGKGPEGSTGPSAKEAIAKRQHLHELVQKQKKKGYVQIVTNRGAFSVQLHCDIAPITCDNFLHFARSHYFENQIFHRLIPNFMIQGGDPTGSGRGGQSAFGGPLPDEFDDRLRHDEAGVLSMANNGKQNDNKSQFFITFAPCPHLDRKHTVFGKIVGGMAEFMRLNATPTNSNDVPIDPISLERVVVVEDPFEAIIRASDEKTVQDAETKKQAFYIQAARSDPMAHHPNRASMAVGKYIDWANLEETLRRKSKR
jgi:peptidyl-prolyl cis-trans isomerase-like protein 2